MSKLFGNLATERRSICSSKKREGGKFLDTIKAVVQKVIREGKHGPFAVATSNQLEGSVTLSLEPTVWMEKEWPEEGMIVFLGELRQKRAGWRAKHGRFWKPSDEQTQQTERSKQMKNVELIKGKCAICRGPIDKQWAGENPSLGTMCRNCSDKRDEVFGLENVEIVVQKHLRFDPLLGVHEYHFDWRGSRIMVNGKVGTIISPQADGDFVRFEGEKTRSLGTFIKGVGYWDLLRIYKAAGGETEPPALDFGSYTPTKAELLDEPILVVKVEMDNGNIHNIQVGNRSTGFGRMFAPTELPNLSTLHAFANLYVRYKFGLVHNYCAEGGFLGNDFEVRNAEMFTGDVGLSVRMNRLADDFRYVNTPEDFHRLAVKEGLVGMIAEREQSRPGVIKDASAHEVLSTWVNVMETLLRYDWREFTFETVEDVWKHYCRMQDVLLNIMSVDELTEALAYVRKGKMTHCGSSY